MKKFHIIMLVVAATLFVLITVSNIGDRNQPEIRNKDPVYKATGWTIDDFIEWAYKVQPVKEHKRWKIWEDGKRELMKEEPKPLCEPFHYGVRIDANDVALSYPMYSYEWVFELPKDVPIPIVKVLERIDFNDVGKYIGEFLPYAKKPVAICALKKSKPISSENVEVKLLSLSDNKLSFSVETEPFILSMISEVRGKIGDKMVLYVPLDCQENVNICKPERKGGSYEK